MIRCRVCDRSHDAGTRVCSCGADLTVDGVAIGADARFGDADLGTDLPDLDDLPGLAESPGLGGDEPSLTDEITIPGPDDTVRLPGPEPDEEADPPPTPPTPRSRRQFAVRPTDESGGPTRGVGPTPTRPPDPDESDPAPVPIAPVVDDLGVSVFAGGDDGDIGWSGADDVRRELRVERAGGVRPCPVCGLDVTADRRFCRCGHQFDPPVEREPVPVEEPSRVTAWWRRITGTGTTRHGDQRGWSQRAKDTGARSGLRYATRMSGRTRMGRTGLMVAGGAGLLLALGPLRDQVGAIPRLFSADEPTELTAWTPGDCDAAAREGPDSPWQAGRPESGGDATAGPGECPAMADTIDGTFDESVDIDRMTIEIGQTSGQTEVNRRQPVMSPSLIAVEFLHPDGEPTIVEVDLQDTAAIQEFSTASTDTTGFSIEVLEVHDHEWEELEIVQIAQVAFFRD